MKDIIFFIIVILAIVSVSLYAIGKTFYEKGRDDQFVEDRFTVAPKDNYVAPDPCGLAVVRCENEDPEFIANYIRKEFKAAGLDGELAVKVAECESYLDPTKNYTNEDGSIDRGLWMINSKHHKEISDECSYSYSCATSKAIEITKKWGNMNAWVCYSHKLVK